VEIKELGSYELTGINGRLKGKKGTKSAKSAKKELKEEEPSPKGLGF